MSDADAVPKHEPAFQLSDTMAETLVLAHAQLPPDYLSYELQYSFIRSPIARS